MAVFLPYLREMDKFVQYIKMFFNLDSEYSFGNNFGHFSLAKIALDFLDYQLTNLVSFNLDLTL